MRGDTPRRGADYISYRHPHIYFLISGIRILTTEMSTVMAIISMGCMDLALGGGSGGVKFPESDFLRKASCLSALMDVNTNLVLIYGD